MPYYGYHQNKMIHVFCSQMQCVDFHSDGYTRARVMGDRPASDIAERMKFIRLKQIRLSNLSHPSC